MRALRPGFGSSSATVAILMLVCALLLHTHFLPRPSMADGPASVHTEEYDAPHPNEAAKPFRASRLALGRGPNPSQASSPERNPALQGGVGAISGMKAGVSDHKGSSDEEEPFLPAVRRVSEQGGLSDGVLLAMG
ncbi:MAG: hypothetical protein LBC94_01830, partial [Desulfovibrio sp.]|nr:hypothetical protein [Desulfovibrio sp.]